MKYLEIVSLDKYQHYSDRETIWIKWYTKCLNDFKFCKLTDSERWIFIGLVMVAIETSNSTPYEPLWIAQRICFRHPKGSYRVSLGVKKMIKIGLITVKNAITERKKEDKSKKKEAFYHNQKVVEKFGKLYVIEKGGEILFTGNKKDIIYK